MTSGKTAEMREVFAIAAEARRIERERICQLFESLASQMDKKADEDDTDAGLVWVAAASSIRRVCNESAE